MKSQKRVGELFDFFRLSSAHIVHRVSTGELSAVRLKSPLKLSLLNSVFLNLLSKFILSLLSYQELIHDLSLFLDAFGPTEKRSTIFSNLKSNNSTIWLIDGRQQSKPTCLDYGQNYDKNEKLIQQCWFTILTSIASGKIPLNRSWNQSLQLTLKRVKRTTKWNDWNKST